MRVTLAAVMLAALAGLTLSIASPTFQAQAQECTGENCPPSTGQDGGRDCGSKRKQQTIS